MKLLNFPRGRQTYMYDCWPKVLQMVMAYYWVEVRTEKLMKFAKTKKKTWTTIKNMGKVLHKYWFWFDSEKMNIEKLIQCLDKNIPIILLLQAREDYHRVVAIWYDDTRIVFEDPYSFHRVYISYDELLERRHGKEQGKNIKFHGIAVYGKEILYDENKIVYMEK